MQRLSLALMLLAAGAFAQSRDERWSADLAFYFDTLQHFHPFLRTPPPNWAQDVSALRARIPTLTDAQILVEANRLTARLGDAHTLVYYTGANGFRFLPLRLRWLSDGFYVVNAGGAARPALGQRVRAIHGLPVDDVFERARAVLPHENLSWARASAPSLMVSPEVLHALGVIPAAAAAVRFDLDNGASVELTVDPGAALTAFPRKGRSLWPLNERSPGLFYWFDWLPESKTLYVKYNVCREDPALPIAAFADELIAVAAEGQPARIVFDLRHNGGGNEAVFLGLLERLGLALQAGRFPFPTKGSFAIIGRQTFSSAVANALALKQNGVTLVGEPTGGKPSGPGEVLAFTFPESRAVFQVSTRLFIKPGYETVESLLPDLAVDLTHADVAAERDPFLARILEGGL